MICLHFTETLVYRHCILSFIYIYIYFFSYLFVHLVPCLLKSLCSALLSLPISIFLWIIPAFGCEHIDSNFKLESNSLHVHTCPVMLILSSWFRLKQGKTLIVSMWREPNFPWILCKARLDWIFLRRHRVCADQNGYSKAKHDIFNHVFFVCKHKQIISTALRQDMIQHKESLSYNK